MPQYLFEAIRALLILVGASIALILTIMIIVKAVKLLKISERLGTSLFLGFFLGVLGAATGVVLCLPSYPNADTAMDALPYYAAVFGLSFAIVGGILVYRSTKPKK